MLNRSLKVNTGSESKKSGEENFPIRAAANAPPPAEAALVLAALPRIHAALRIVGNFLCTVLTTSGHEIRKLVTESCSLMALSLPAIRQRNLEEGAPARPAWAGMPPE